MIIVVIGSVGSASTWMFNVVRDVLAKKNPLSVSVYADKADDILGNCPHDNTDIVVKSHSLDSQMSALINLTKTKIIFTNREPSDSVVSQFRRFGHTLDRVVRDISHTYASIAMVYKNAEILSLHYNEQFFDDLSTICRVVDFLDLDLIDFDAESVFNRYGFDNVKMSIQSSGLFGDQDADVSVAAKVFDNATQWHPGHLGDGKSGNGERLLAKDDLLTINQACRLWDQYPAGSGQSVVWTSKLFVYHDERTPKLGEIIELNPEEKILVWGPYMFLPVGRWRVRPKLMVLGTDALNIKIDVFVASIHRNILAAKSAIVVKDNVDNANVDFVHFDHCDQIEIRIYSTKDSRGRILFEGFELIYEGPVQFNRPMNSRSTSDNIF